ncbi:hypothetical protein DM790_15400 [Flavobacterium collinsii]|nr:hypothetical protein [Flavobacterium collinsii]
MKNGILYFTFLILFSCGNQPYELRFDKYEDLKETTNPRIKGWFPNIINSDSYDLRSDSHLNICDFVKFSYSENQSYDSIFLKNPKVTVVSFQQKIKENENFKPKWFPNSEEINLNDFEIVLADGFDVARKKSTKEIFCICNPNHFPIR